MLCDGRIVCGCADPYAKRVLGDARKTTVEDIWTGETITTLRADMNAGGSEFCGDCALKRPLGRERNADRARARRRAGCRGGCSSSARPRATSPATRRAARPKPASRARAQAGMLDFDLFTRVIDEVGPTLGRIDFFNYGEAFLHKRAVEMCEYIKSRHPHIYLYTSTNGTALAKSRRGGWSTRASTRSRSRSTARRPDSYVQYRQRGKFDVAMRNLRAMADEKRKSGRDLPQLNWRYILFKWNDSDEEMNLARRMARDIGVDRLCWEVTDHPEDSFSRRFVAGSPDSQAIRRETWDDSNLGNAIPGATPRARIDVRDAGVPSCHRRCR